jgi:hypothetical protein
MRQSTSWLCLGGAMPKKTGSAQGNGWNWKTLLPKGLRLLVEAGTNWAVCDRPCFQRPVVARPQAERRFGGECFGERRSERGLYVEARSIVLLSCHGGEMDRSTEMRSVADSTKREQQQNEAYKRQQHLMQHTGRDTTRALRLPLWHRSPLRLPGARLLVQPALSKPMHSRLSHQRRAVNRRRAAAVKHQPRRPLKSLHSAVDTGPTTLSPRLPWILTVQVSRLRQAVYPVTSFCIHSCF